MKSTKDEEMKTNCPHCGVAVGQPHLNKCLVELCSVCGLQRFYCNCEGHEPSVWPHRNELKCYGCETTHPFAAAIAEGWVTCCTDGEYDIFEPLCPRCQQGSVERPEEFDYASNEQATEEFLRELFEM